MPFQTQAAVVRKQGGPFVFEKIELDDPRPDEVIVRMIASGICHTDIAARDGSLGMNFPAVFGHEGAGIVEIVGADVRKVRAGDKVVLSFSSCGYCAHCRADRPSHCDSFDGLNFDGARPDGSPSIRDARGRPVSGLFLGQSSLAFHALTRERNLIMVDAGQDEMALLAPFGCGVQTGAGTVLNELKPGAGDAVAVFGTGAVGLSALMAARMAGAGLIVAVDIVPFRLEVARKLGAHLALDARGEDVLARIRELAPKGVDHAVETTGHSRVIDQAIRTLGPEGNLSLVGISADAPDELITPQRPGPGQKVFYTVAGDSNPQKFIPFLIEAFRNGKFPVDALERQYPASRINEAVSDSLSGLVIKPVLRF
ncbi:MAG: NAD(P)-dependent alcohol dehydrogenase [Syntrophobacter sp.]